MKAVEALKKWLTDKNTMIVQNENGGISEASFIWNAPATIEEIKSFEDKTGIILPEQYKDFLQVSDGVTLFKDLEYGQWGCKLLGLDEIITVTNSMKEYRRELNGSCITFA